MSVKTYLSVNSDHKVILFGNDTDVTSISFIRLGYDIIIETQYFIDESAPLTKDSISTRVLTMDEFTKVYELQMDTPMQYISYDQYVEFVNQF